MVDQICQLLFRDMGNSGTDIEILKDGNAFGSGSWHIRVLSGFKWLKTPPGQVVGSTFSYPKKVVKGGIFRTEGKYTYRKTEKGWVR